MKRIFEFYTGLFFLLIFVSCQTSTHVNKLIRQGKSLEAQAEFLSKEDPGMKDRNGNTPLHVAAEANNGELCQFFINRGIPIESRNEFGETPLFVATKNGSALATRILLTNKADITVRDNKGISAQKYFLENDSLIDECVKAKISIYPASSTEEKNTDRDYDYFEDCLRTYNVNLRFEFALTPLHYATSRNHREIVKFLIRRNADINAVNINGQTPLHYALEYGNAELFLRLLDAGADVNARDVSGKNSLHYISVPKPINDHSGNFTEKLSLQKETVTDIQKASDKSLCDFIFDNKITLQQYDIYKILLDFGADTNSKDSGGNAALHIAINRKLDLKIFELLISAGANFLERNKNGSTPLSLAVSNSMPKHSEFLINMGADIHSEDILGYTPLIGAIASNSMEMLKAVINDRNVESRDKNGNTPLHIAVDLMASTACLEHIHRCMITLDVDAQNLKGNTPLYLAIKNNHKEAGLLLLQWKANVFLENMRGYSPLHLAFDLGGDQQDWIINDTVVAARDSLGNTALHFAAEWKKDEAVTKLLDAGANINAKNQNGETPIFFAMKANSVSTIRLFADNKRIDLDARDKLGNSVLHTGVTHMADNATLVLFGYGIDKEAQNLAGKTPLGEAVSQNRRGMIRLYLENKANVNAADARGITILIDSVKKKNYENVKMLLDAGASAELQSVDGKTAFHEAVLGGNITMIKLVKSANSDPLIRDIHGESPLSLAFKTKNEEIVASVLPDNINAADSEGNTPIHLGILHDIDDFVFELMVKKGYPVDRRNKNGSVALLDAIKQGKFNLAEILLDNNANPFVKDKDDSSVSIAMIQKYDILNKIIEVTGEKKDEAGDTLLHYGAKYGDERTVMRLLDLGFSKQERNTAEQTPYDVAVAWQRPYIADILKL